MRRKSHFRILSLANAVLAGAFLFLLQSALLPAAAQEPQPPPPSPAAAQQPQPQPSFPVEAQGPQSVPAKSKKVWTNDELESSRTPMDQYLVDKEANEAAAAEQAAADAIAFQQALARIKMPATAEETQRAIDDAHQDINDEKDAIDRLNKEFETAPAEQKAGIQREIDRHTTGVQTSQQELKALHDHLKQLTNKPLGANSANSGKQPSQ